MKSSRPLAVLASFLILFTFAFGAASIEAGIRCEAIAADSPPPMITAAWNYSPDRSVSQIRRIVSAGFGYDNAYRAGPPAGYGWDLPWDWSRVRLDLSVDGRPATDAEAVARLRELPVLDLVTLYRWATWHSAPPPDFSREGIDKTRDLIAALRLRLKAAGLSEYKLDRLNIVVDAENAGPQSISVWADPNGIHKDQPLAANVPNLATVCYLISEAFRSCKWEQRDSALMLNYSTAHGAMPPPKLGAAPFWRATPLWVPGSCSDGIFQSLYWSGGPSGCLTELEANDVIDRAPAPIWLALEDNNPGLLRILARAKASGKVRLVLLWGNGKAADTGDHHREISAGASLDWIRSQDASIYNAVR